MAVQSFLRDLDGLFNYSTDENPTSQQDYQEAVKNWVDTIKSLVDCTLWQPDTEYSVGNVLRTPSLPYELQLTCVTAGTSGSAEPDYTDVDAGDIITDGTAEFRVDYSLVEGALASTNDVPSGVTFGSTTLLSKMIANMNTQDGVQYNLSNANSWYICLGAKYGGLIIQGGTKTISLTATNQYGSMYETSLLESSSRLTFPITYGSYVTFNASLRHTALASLCVSKAWSNLNCCQVNYVVSPVKITTAVSVDVNYIAIGK